jgi:hypothetical protein
VRQDSLGKEEATTRKPFAGTLRGIDPRPAELGQRPEASLARCRGDPTCEAKTASERAVLLSPEINTLAGADVVQVTEGRVVAPRWPGAHDPAGVGGQGTLTSGFPRNLGGPAASAACPGGSPGDQLQARGRRTRRPRERIAGATAVPPNEGDEVRRDGRLGVGASRRTMEAGEPPRGTPPRAGDTGP